jgi:hypothetical protein
MNNLVKPAVYGLTGAVVGWIVAAAITIVLAVIAGILAVIEIRFLIVLVVLFSLAAPIVPAYLIGSLVNGVSQNLTKKSAGLVALIVALLLASIPLILIINSNFPVELMTNTLEQPAWVGTAMTGYAWLLVALSPIIAFALAAEISIGSAAADRSNDTPQG